VSGPDGPRAWPWRIKVEDGAIPGQTGRGAASAQANLTGSPRLAHWKNSGQQFLIAGLGSGAGVQGGAALPTDNSAESGAGRAKFW